MANESKKALGGKTLEQYQSEKDAAYKKAYGNKTDIVKRVADYNDSQDTGAAVVKVGAKIVGSALVGAATGGAASGILMGALISSGVSFAVDATDMMSDGREHSLGEYGSVAGDAVVDGVTQAISGGTSKFLKASNVGKVTRYATKAVVDMTLDGGVDYMRTGEFHLSTIVMSGVSSVGGEMLGDFMEARAKRKAVEKEFSQLEIKTTDPLDDVPSNWATMTPDERRANLRQRQIDHENWIKVNGGPALDASAVEIINPEHSRYVVTVNPDEMGGVQTQDLGNGIKGIVDDPGHIRVDVTSSQMRHAIADVGKLGINPKSEFGRGLVKLENIQQAKVSYTSRADGLPEYAAVQGLGEKGSGVSTRSVITAPDVLDWRNSAGMREDVYQTLKERGIIGDSQLLEDCAELSSRAYDKKLDDVIFKDGKPFVLDKKGNRVAEKPFKGSSGDWDRIMSQTNESTGFNARAYKNGDKVMIIFRGSDDVADLSSDFRMMTGKTPEQLNEALSFVEAIKQQYPDANIVVTGHSLGGSLTELTAAKYGDVVGISFDAVGTKNIIESSGGALKDNHNTISCLVHSDAISNADAHAAQVLLVGNVTKGGGVLSPHSMANFTGTNSALDGAEKGFLARHVEANAKATKLSAVLAEYPNGSITLEDKQFKGIAKSFEYEVNTMGADLDQLESQVNRLSSCEQKEKLQGLIDKRRVELLADADLDAFETDFISKLEDMERQEHLRSLIDKRIHGITSSTDIKANSNTLRTLSGDEVNNVLARDFGFNEPGFLTGESPSSEIVTRKPTKFVRVYNDQSSFAKGTWLMPYDEVVGKTPAEIKDFYALPAMPKYVVEVEIPAGTKMFTGKCNPVWDEKNVNRQWGHGGGTQYFVTNNFEIPTRLENQRLIPVAKK